MPSAAAKAQDVSVTTMNDELIEAMFTFLNEGEEACIGMFPRQNVRCALIMIKKLVETCKLSKWTMDNTKAELREELLKVKSLDLTGNKIVDVTPLAALAALVNLTELHLDENEIVDVAPLAALVNLTELHLCGNQIENLAPLAVLVNLTELHLSVNQLLCVAPLAALVNLTELHLVSNKKEMIRDLARLEGLKHLKKLYLNRNVQNPCVDCCCIPKNLHSLHKKGTKIVIGMPFLWCPLCRCNVDPCCCLIYLGSPIVVAFGGGLTCACLGLAYFLVCAIFEFCWIDFGGDSETNIITNITNSSQ